MWKKLLDVPVMDDACNVITVVQFGETSVNNWDRIPVIRIHRNDTDRFGMVSIDPIQVGKSVDTDSTGTGPERKDDCPAPILLQRFGIHLLMIIERKRGRPEFFR